MNGSTDTGCNFCSPTLNSPLLRRGKVRRFSSYFKVTHNSYLVSNALFFNCTLFPTPQKANLSSLAKSFILSPCPPVIRRGVLINKFTASRVESRFSFRLSATFGVQNRPTNKAMIIFAVSMVNAVRGIKVKSNRSLRLHRNPLCRHFTTHLYSTVNGKLMGFPCSHRSSRAVVLWPP